MTTDTQLAPTDAEIIALLRPLPQLARQLAAVSALAVGALLGAGAAALGCGLVGALHHCAPGGCRLSSKSRI